MFSNLTLNVCPSPPLLQDPSHVLQFDFECLSVTTAASSSFWFKIHLMLAKLNVCPLPPLLQAHSSSRSISCSPI
ncbi:unnamed protein product [Ambrosiozyma monospora]|uniref:Unnamed protein product n=1 Tax=Ambrosiozyma monospora TaxID=43982 RepID=A0A9W6T5N5_AMBMO|nr:unnamed protein product [Ambrosiozyma monospora]